MNLSRGKLFFVIKNIVLLFVCVICNIKVYANNPPIYYPPNNKSNDFNIIDYFGAYNANADFNQKGLTPVEGYIDNSSFYILLNYFHNQVVKNGSMNNYHEENYVYTDGRKEDSSYNGILGYAIKDFDNDGFFELAIFKIVTIEEKYIVLDIFKCANGSVVPVTSEIIYRGFLDAEDITFDISVKKYNDEWIMYFDILEKNVYDNIISNYFVAVKYFDVISIVTEASYSSSSEDFYYDDNINFVEQIIDAGVIVKDEDNIFNRAFLNDDVAMEPIATMRRVNESMREGYIEDYIETHFDEYTKNGFVKIRYGYTTFTQRN